MKIPLTLNNKKIVLSAQPSEKLLAVLRRQKLYSVKCGCQKGICGNCTVLMNDEIIPSCIVPIGIIRDAKIVTLEKFKTYPEYQDITSGFSKAGVNLCGYCNAGKIFTAYSILKKYFRPSTEQILEVIKSLTLCCTDIDTLTNGILYAIAAKHLREGKNQNAKK